MTRQRHKVGEIVQSLLQNPEERKSTVCQIQGYFGYNNTMSLLQLSIAFRHSYGDIGGSMSLFFFPLMSLRKSLIFLVEKQHVFQIYGQLIFIFKANKRCHPSLVLKIRIQRKPKIFCLPFNWNSSCDTLPLWDIVTAIIFSIEWNWNTERISSARGESDLCTINAAGIWRQKSRGMWTCSDFES